MFLSGCRVLYDFHDKFPFITRDTGILTSWRSCKQVFCGQAEGTQIMIWV